MTADPTTTFWREYAAFTGSVSVYPDANKKTEAAQSYASLGLVNEAGELAGKVKKLLRDGNSDMKTYESKGVPFLEAARDELGDATFYAMRCSVEFGFEVDLWPESCKAAVPKDDILKVDALVDATLALSSRAGDFAGDVLEDQADWGIVHDVVQQLAIVALILDTTLEEVARANIEKLSGRKERGTLKGDGDKR